MPFDQINEQQLAKAMIAGGLKQNRLSHAYIFNGPRGSGRKLAATLLAQALYCKIKEHDACGECTTCRQIEHRNHPDIHWLEPETSTIKIEQIRVLQKQLSFRSSTSGKIVYIIEQAERMTVPAANSLLKILEDPASDMIAVLLTENARALLSTIQSRAQLVPFVRLSEGAMAENLIREGYSENLVRCAVHLHAGTETAKAMMETDWFAEIRNVMVQLAKESLTRYPVAISIIHQQLTKGEIAVHADILLQLWLLWCKDLIWMLHGQPERVVFKDEIAWMDKAKFSQNSAYWFKNMEHILESQKRLRMHVNAQLVFEQLIYKMQGESLCIPL